MNDQAPRDRPAVGTDRHRADEAGYHDPPMTIWEHLAELRTRLIISLVALVAGAAVAWELREELLAILVAPFAEAWVSEGIAGRPLLHFQSPAAAFLGYFKISLLGGAILGAPVIFYEVWAFVAPGLYAREKRFIVPFVLSSTALFAGGCYFGWRVAFPILFKYLLGLSGTLESVDVTVAPTVMMGDYVNFVTELLLGFGIIFEIPLFVFFLAIAGIVNYLHLVHYGRWFVVGAFVLAAALTPPDVTSQILMAVPMVVLYGASIGVAKVFGKPPTEAQREAYRRKRRPGRKPPNER